MHRLALAPLLALMVTPAVAVEPLTPPHVAAEMFCMGRTTGDMGLAQDYLTPELRDAIEKALAQNDMVQKAHPDEKPPLGDGVPWSTFQDAVSQCDVDYEAAKATPTEVPITFSFPESPDAGWTDTLVLKDVEGTWKVDDVLYSDGGRLTETLVSAFD